MRHRVKTLLVLLLVSGCGVSPLPVAPPPTPAPRVTPSPVKARPTGEWYRDWERGEPCAFPCVEGITPGHTTLEAAIALLNQNPRVRNVRITPRIDLHLVEWDWVYGSGGGQAVYDPTQPQPVITAIFVMPPTNPPLQAILDTYGTPTHVLATRYADPHDLQKYQSEVVIFYQDQGFYVLIDPPVITNTARIQTVTTFAPDLPLAQRPLRVRLSEQRLVPWAGFQDFWFYCRPKDPHNTQICQP